VFVYDIDGRLGDCGVYLVQEAVEERSMATVRIRIIDAYYRRWTGV